MGLLAPIALVAIPLLGAIIILYLLRMRRPSAPIASLELWDESVRDREANALWQRLQMSLLLVLQLIVLLALILALARPWVADKTSSARNLVLVVDNSASMGSADGGHRRISRLDAAKSKALELVDGLHSGQVASVLSANSHAAVLISGADDKARLRSVISSLQSQPTAPTDIVPALKLANVMAAKQGNSEIWLFSDGQFGPAREQVGSLHAPLNFYQVGRTSDNQAITALSINHTTGQPQLFVQVFNSDAFPVTRRVDLMVDEVPWDARNLTIPAGATLETIIDNVPLGARVIKAGFSVPDSLPLDDSAWTINREAVPGTVLLVSTGNKFLESALALLPNVNLYKVDPVSYDPTDTVAGSQPDLVVFDVSAAVPPTDTLPASNLLLIAPALNGPYIQSTMVITGPTGITGGTPKVQGDRTDTLRESLLKFVDLSQAHVERSAVLTVPPWAETIVQSEEGPLLVAGEVDERKIAAVGFDFKDTDLPLQPAFPLLIRNLVSYLLPPAEGTVPVSVAPETAVQIKPASDEVESILVEDPEGIEWTYEVISPQDSIDFSETRLPGVYYITEYSAGEVTSQEAFAVNLFSRDESNIAPVLAPSLPVAEAPDAVVDSRGDTRPRELWPLVALAAFFLLIFEWLYAQRIVIRRALTEMRSRRALRKLGRM